MVRVALEIALDRAPLCGRRLPLSALETIPAGWHLQESTVVARLLAQPQGKSRSGMSALCRVSCLARRLPTQVFGP